MAFEVKDVFLLSVTILMGVVFVGIIANNNAAIQTTGTSLLENTTVLTSQINTWVSLDNNDLIAVQAVYNSTYGSLTVDTQYKVDTTNGYLNITTAGNNTNGESHYYINYTYYPDNYVKNSSSRDLMNTTLIMFVIALVIICFVYIQKNDIFRGK